MSPIDPNGGLASLLGGIQNPSATPEAPIDPIAQIRAEQARKQQEADAFQRKMTELAQQREQFASQAGARRANEQQDFDKYVKKSYEDKFSFAGKMGPAVATLVDMLHGAAVGIGGGKPTSLRQTAQATAAKNWQEINQGLRQQEQSRHATMLEQQNLLSQQGATARAQAGDLSRQATQLETSKKNETDAQWRMMNALTAIQRAKTDDEYKSGLLQLREADSFAKTVGAMSTAPAMYAFASGKSAGDVQKMVLAGMTDAGIKQLSRTPPTLGTATSSSGGTVEDANGGWHTVNNRTSQKILGPRANVDPAAVAQALTGVGPAGPQTPLAQATGGLAPKPSLGGSGAPKPASPVPSSIPAGGRFVGNKAMETTRAKEALGAQEASQSINDVHNQVDNLLRSRVSGPNGKLLTENIFGPILGSKLAGGIRGALGIKGGDESLLDLGLMEKAFATARANVGSGRLAQQEVKMFQNTLASKHEDYDSVLAGLTALRLSKELDAYHKDWRMKHPQESDSINLAGPVQAAMDSYLSRMRKLRQFDRGVDRLPPGPEKEQLLKDRAAAAGRIQIPTIKTILMSQATGQ